MVQKGILLINLGTPAKLTKKEIRTYLKAFLSDPRVIDIPAIFRWMLLHFIILPFRPQKIIQNYQKIWTKEGSPLWVHTRDLSNKLQQKCGKSYHVMFAMTYGEPAIKNQLEKMISKGVTHITVAPLYPQYASATYGGVLEQVFRILIKQQNVPAVQVLPPFFKTPEFIESVVDIGKKHTPNKVDHTLFSFHGLPRRQLEKANKQCFSSKHCCDVLDTSNSYCYRAQCLSTAKEIAHKLNLTENQYSISFQSRLGRAEWLQPYTTDKVEELAKSGVEHLVIYCPAFVSDCLETLEEIEIQEKQNFLHAGGKTCTVVPCINSSDLWVDSLFNLISKNSFT